MEIFATEQKGIAMLESATKKEKQCYDLHLLMIFSILVASFSFPAFFPQKASAATRISADSSCLQRCYAVADWTNVRAWNNLPVQGATTGATVVPMNGGDLFAESALWVVDTNPGESENCQIAPDAPKGACWIEVGYKSYGTDAGSVNGIDVANTERWVWADVAPNNYYYEHPAPSVLASGDYNNSALFFINIEQGTTWGIVARGAQTSFSTTSEDNSMRADDIKIGLELSGNAGWQAPEAEYIQNLYRAADDNWYPETTDGLSEITNYPADGYWADDPTTANSGGTFVTCVTGAGC
jgi:hypothetical protein